MPDDNMGKLGDGLGLLGWTSGGVMGQLLAKH